MFDPWAAVVGQARTVELLRRAALRPVHAYLLVGGRGSGAEDAARAFAATLVGADDDRPQRRAHPDVVEFEPVANAYSVAEVREGIIPEVHRSPIEGARKVVIVLDAERLQGSPGSGGAPASALLKTLEEPPARAVLLLVTAAPGELLDTIRSRCQRVDLAALDVSTLRDALEREGIESGRAELAARLAGGQMARARLLAGRYARLRDAFSLAPTRLDGSGAAAVTVAEDLVGAVQDAATGLRTTHEAEAAELDVEIERAGYPPRAAQALTRRLRERQKREDRRARTEALHEGITALESMYRDALATGAPRINADREVLAVSPRAAADALDACSEARRSFEFNPNESLLLERLMLHLPAVGAATYR
ncbi:MAG: DNA polymerase III subunit [Acidimicrobiia bacterium]